MSCFACELHRFIDSERNPAALVLFITVLRRKVTVVYNTSWKPISVLRSVKCHMGSHLTQVNVPHLNPSQAGRPVLDLPIPQNGKLS